MGETEMANRDVVEKGIVYSSGVFIHDEAYISTLSVIYERVYLPYIVFKDTARLVYKEDDYDEEQVLKTAWRWREAHSLLFSEGVLVRIPHPYLNTIESPNFEAEIMSFMKAHSLTLRNATPLQIAEVAFIFDTVSHILRNDISAPRIFMENPTTLSRNSLVGLEAFATFRYLLPKLSTMRPDEILELRRKVKDIREGFTMHLQKLSKELDSMVKAGEKLEDLNGYAQNIVETELIPDYREFRRQLEAEQAGKIKKVLDVAGEILEIDAAPWTPKFWGMLLKALGMLAIETAADQKERLSNRYQAYEFMKVVEDTGRI